MAENDYNLSISSYVNTFEEEKRIDLTAVSKALKAIGKEMATTDNIITYYYNQLGIDTPF